MTDAQELAKLLETLEDAYWRLKDLIGNSDLPEDDTDKVEEIITSLNQFFA